MPKRSFTRGATVYIKRGKRYGRPSRKQLRRSRSKKKTNKIVHAFTRYVSTFNHYNVDVNSTITSQGSSGNTELIWTTANTSASYTGLGIAFCIDDLWSTSDFSTLFDQYSLRGVLINIRLVSNPYSASAVGVTTTNTTNIFPVLYYVKDQDDIVYPNINTLREYATVKKRILQPNKDIKIFLRPSALQAMYVSTSSVLRGQAKYRQWLDMADTDVQHFGLKLGFETPTAVFSSFAQQWQMLITAKYYFMCKNPK